jgi:hypothetical protein
VPSLEGDAGDVKLDITPLPKKEGKSKAEVTESAD